MKFLYCTSINFPSIFANRIQTICMAKQFGEILGDAFYLGGHSIDLGGLNIVNFKGSRKSYFLAIKYLRFIKRERITHVFSREDKLLFFMLLYNKLFFRLKLKFIYEAHGIPEKPSFFYYRFVVRSMDRIISLTSFTKKELQVLGAAKENILVAPDGVDIHMFNIGLTRKECREKLGLPKEKNMVVYAGHLYGWKGVDVLLEAGKFLKKNINIYFIGGAEKDLKEFREKAAKSDSVFVVGQVPHNKIPLFLGAADALVLPNSAKSIVSRYYTSPMKLFEYMASSRPIVASNLPAIKEVLNENNSVLVNPDDPMILAEGINKVLQDGYLSAQISKQAYLDARKYTWSNRAGKILNFIK